MFKKTYPGHVVHSRHSSETHNAFVESISATVLFYFFFFFKFSVDFSPCFDWKLSASPAAPSAAVMRCLFTSSSSVVRDWQIYTREKKFNVEQTTSRQLQGKWEIVASHPEVIEYGGVGQAEIGTQSFSRVVFRCHIRLLPLRVKRFL